MSSHQIVSVDHKPALAGVCIDGWEATCKCGFRTSNSLGERWARKQGYEHADYMTAKEARR